MEKGFTEYKDRRKNKRKERNIRALFMDDVRYKITLDLINH